MKSHFNGKDLETSYILQCSFLRKKLPEMLTTVLHFNTLLLFSQATARKYCLCIVYIVIQNKVSFIKKKLADGLLSSVFFKEVGCNPCMNSGYLSYIHFWYIDQTTLLKGPLHLVLMRSEGKPSNRYTISICYQNTFV